MRRDIIISGVIAVAVHTLILSGSLPRVSTTNGREYEPVSLSVIHHREPVSGKPSVGQRVETGPRPHSLPENNSPVQHPIVQTRQDQKKTLVAKPLAKHADVNEGRAEHILKPSAEALPENLVELLDDPSFLTASIPRHGPKGDGPAHGTVTLAIPKYKDNPPPHYPEVARRRGYEGRALLRVEVLESGKVGRMEIASSSGFEVLDSAAQRSVRGWAFVPGTQNGAETRQWVMVPIRFSLN